MIRRLAVRLLSAEVLCRREKPGSFLLHLGLAAVLTAGLLAPSPGAGAEQASPKWLAVDEWSGSFSVDRNIKKIAELDGMTEVIEVREHTSGKCSLNDKYTEEGFATWTGPFEATTRITAVRTLSYGSVTITERLSGIGSATDANEYGEAGGLSIDINDGRYDVSFSGGNPELTWDRAVDGATREAVEKLDSGPVRDLFTALLDGFESGKFDTGLASGIGFLPGNQMEFSDMGSWFDAAAEEGQPLPGKTRTLSGKDTWNRPGTTVVRSWRISPGKDTTPEYFLTVENLSDFKEMLPEPESRVRLRVYTKARNPVHVPMRFTITEVSREPGTCLNELNEESGGEDLEFDLQSSPTALYRDGEGAIRTKEAVGEALVDVKIKDYGAYGKIAVQLEFDDLRISVPVDFNGEPELSIPYDENHNTIADKWERDKNIYMEPGYERTWDEEEIPALDGEPGDGLSVYEEYRGLKIRGEHGRLDPVVKEFVVSNHIGDAIRPGLTLFSKASGVAIVELNQDELPESRVVNLYSDTGRTRDQYGVVIRRVASLRDGAVGQARSVGNPDNVPDSPRTTRDILIAGTMLDLGVGTGESRVGGSGNAGGEDTGAGDDNDADAECRTVWKEAELSERKAKKIREAVAHEMGHSLGARHHGNGEASGTMLGVDSQFEAFDLRGREITERPLRICGPVGVEHGLGSGSETCLMRYNEIYMWRIEITKEYRKQYHRMRDTMELTSFCTSGDGGANPLGDADLGHGNCLGRMRVKDGER